MATHQFIRPLKAALNSNGRFRYKAPESVVDFLVIGGGVVGLATAQRLTSRFPDLSTVLVERHPHAGEEVSSRNSEVIHSGLYYPPNSFKTRLCLRGRDLLYERCRASNIPYRNTGKLVVATSKDQFPYIKNLHSKSLELSSRRSGSSPFDHLSLQSSSENDDIQVLQTTLLSGEAARQMEPDLSEGTVGALWCPQTGIIDSHALMETFERDILDSENGDLAYATKVVRIDPYKNNAYSLAPNPSGGVGHDHGWVVQTLTSGSIECEAILARTIINAGGLSSTLILNAILPPESRLPMYYARGSYASYNGPGTSSVSHLIYPCPHTGPNAHAFQSLGTHLTLDLNGKIRFGPDIEWISAPLETGPDGNEDNADFWMKQLAPDERRLVEMYQAVTDYLPGVRLNGFQSDYTGMRPKLVPPTGGFQDFVFRMEYADPISKKAPMLNMLGIESPGLTSSLAIAEIVVDELLALRYL